jgi:hypothetical protein
MVLDGIGVMIASLQWWREQEKETDQLERNETREAREARAAREVQAQ